MSDRTSARDVRAAGNNRPRSRPRLRTTREGKVYIVVTLGVGVAAINTGNNLLYLVLGFMLSLIVLSGIMSELVLRRVSIERRLPARAFAGTTMLVQVSLSNHKTRASSYSIEIEDLVSNVPSERRCYFLKVGPESEQVTAYRRTQPRRGILTFTGFRIATRYPFGLFEKWRIVNAPGEFVVYPTLASAANYSHDMRLLSANTTSRAAGRGAEIAGLREHRDDDEMRNVHWRRTASLGRMVVRERDREDARHLTLAIDNARPADAGDDWSARLERVISHAASISEKALAAGSSVEIVTRSGRSALVEHGKKPDLLWHFLALIKAVDAADAQPFVFSEHGRHIEWVAA